MLRTGDVLGDRFEILGVLGRGGMATVHLALDRAREERVALKVLHPHLAADPGMRARLRREVQAARLVRAEGALVPYDLHDLDGTVALTMPYHPGRTLAERVAAEGALPSDEVREIGRRILSALAVAHRNGVLHRDVTPNNVMLEGADTAVLTDYGLARVADAGTASVVLGTPGYAAPEVYRGLRTDPRSDLYSLGAVLYLAATGRPPFPSGAPAAALEAQLRGPPTPVRALRPEVDEDLARTIEALLQREPWARPQSPVDVLDALERRVPPPPPGGETWSGADTPSAPVADTPGAAAQRAPAVPAPEDPGAPPEPTPPPPPPVLEPGTYTVVVKRRGWRGGDPAALADAVGRAAGSAVARVPALEKRELRLVAGVSREVAERLANAADAAGYKARAVDATPPARFGRLAQHLWVLVPAVWVSYPFLLNLGLESDVLLPLFILVTLLVGPVRAMLGAPDIPDDLPLAYARDVAGPVPARPQPRGGGTGVPADGASASEAATMRDRALAALAALDAAVTADLPEPAVRDLRETSARLRADAERIGEAAAQAERGLAESPPADGAWIAARLERLAALERAGDPVDPAERARLAQALAEVGRGEAARGALESRLSAGLAQLLEIGAVARRTRLELLAPDAPKTARLVLDELRREARAVADARAAVEAARA